MSPWHSIAPPAITSRMIPSEKPLGTEHLCPTPVKFVLTHGRIANTGYAQIGRATYTHTHRRPTLLESASSAGSHRSHMSSTQSERDSSTHHLLGRLDTSLHRDTHTPGPPRPSRDDCHPEARADNRMVVANHTCCLVHDCYRCFMRRCPIPFGHTRG